MADYMFTENEKRFLLAEIIKSSRLDVDALAMFVRQNRAEADWWNMQMPPSRSMGQCVREAERMGISSPSLKRRSSNDYNDQSSKRPSRAAHPGYPPPVPIQPSYPYPPPPAAHPHASMMHYQAPSDYRQRRQPDKPDPPKKRGRPSRADKAKRDLQPILPRPLAPQLAPQVAHPTHFSPPSHIVDVPPSFNGLAPLAPKRTTLPPMLPSPVRPAGPITPPEAYVTSKGSPRPMNPSSPRSLHPSALSPRSERPRPPSSHENGRPSSSRGGSPPHKRLLVD